MCSRPKQIWFVLAKNNYCHWLHSNFTSVEKLCSWCKLESVFFKIAWSHLRSNWTCWFHNLVELNFISFVSFYLSLYFINLLSFTTYLYIFFIHDITYKKSHQCILLYHIFEFNFLLFEMKGNEVIPHIRENLSIYQRYFPFESIYYYRKS